MRHPSQGAAKVKEEVKHFEGEQPDPLEQPHDEIISHLTHMEFTFNKHDHDVSLLRNTVLPLHDFYSSIRNDIV